MSIAILDAVRDFLMGLLTGVPRYSIVSRTSRNDRLSELAPVFADKAREWLETVGMYLSVFDGGWSVDIIETRRSTERQAALYAKGRTAPGKIVTWKSGAPGDESKHQLGLAFDFVVRDGTGRAVWYGENEWADAVYRRAREMAVSLGMRVLSLRDAGHVEAKS